MSANKIPCSVSEMTSFWSWISPSSVLVRIAALQICLTSYPVDAWIVRRLTPSIILTPKAARSFASTSGVMVSVSAIVPMPVATFQIGCCAAVIRFAFAPHKSGRSWAGGKPAIAAPVGHVVPTAKPVAGEAADFILIQSRFRRSTACECIHIDFHVIT